MPKLKQKDKGVRVKNPLNEEYPAGGNPRPKRSNLQNINDLPPEVAKEIRRKGAYRSHEVRKQTKEKELMKKEMKDILRLLLDEKINNKEARDKIIDKYPQLMDEVITERTILNISLIKRAKREDAVANQAYALIRDTLGEKPVDKQELTGSGGEAIQIVQSQKDIIKMAKELEKELK